MSDHSENAFHAAIKALNEVVAPAVDRANPLAMEQLRLVTSFLEFHVGAAPQARRLQWLELHHQVQMGRNVADVLAGEHPDVAASLRAAVNEGASVLEQTGAPAAHWQEAASRVAAAMSAALTGLSRDGSPVARRVEGLVVEESRHMLDLKRVWFKPYGFEARPERLPALEGVLRQAPEV